MVILALDTTTRAGSVAVMRDDAVLAVIHGDGTRTHGERLPGELDVALQSADLRVSDVELLAVASGPGGFTGLRIGLAAIQGLAMACGRPVIGISALDALADAAIERVAATTHMVAVWMDAQRGEIFAACYRRLAFGTAFTEAGAGPIVGPPEDVLQQLPEEMRRGGVFIGDGAARYREAIARATDDAAIVLDAPAALAPFIGRLARARAARGDAGPPHALQPLYVRRSDAELVKAKTKKDPRSVA